MLVVALGAAALWFLPSVLSDAEGSVTIEIYDANDELVVRDTHEFYGETTLFDMLKEHYDITYEETSFGAGSGKILLAIEGVETDFTNNFLYLEKNETQSFYGIDQQLEDGAVYTISVRRVE